MNLHAWGQQRAQYSPARRGRHERGAAVSECALIQASAQAIGLRRARLVAQRVTGQDADQARSQAA